MFSSSSGVSSALQGRIPQCSFYQQLICSSLTRSIHTSEGIELLGRRLADIARYAYLARQMDAVEQASQIMLALPISCQLRSVARHYQALCAKQKGDYEGARRMLERVVEDSTPEYRARALQITGATYYELGAVDAALPFYIAAGKAAVNCDLLTVIESQRMIAVIRSIHGDHKQALKDIENLFPLVRTTAKRYAPLYYSFLNSLAVELGEVGRINEAQAVCAITLASPFAQAYPEWSETRDELEAKRTRATPSIVAVSPAPSSQTRLASKAKPILALAVNQPAHAKIIFQRSVLLNADNVALALDGAIQIILDRARHSINPRGPPAHFQI
jgi:tetratricopeptide (TPR) repeat protein